MISSSGLGSSSAYLSTTYSCSPDRDMMRAPSQQRTVERRVSGNDEPCVKIVSLTVAWDTVVLWGRRVSTWRRARGTYGRSEGGECDGLVEAEEGGRAGVEEADEVSCDDWGGSATGGGGVIHGTYALPRSTRRD